MARLVNHGGSCCGAKHIYGFSTGNDVTDLDTSLAGMIKGQAVDVILNGDQVRAKAPLLARMAEVGFVLDAHWHNGNHGAQTLPANPTDAQLGSHCYRFTRADRRKALLEGPIAGLWNGMVMTPALTGVLPSSLEIPVDYFTRPLPDGAVSVATLLGRNAGAVFSVGDVCRVTNPRSARVGREFTVTGITPGIGGYYYIFYDERDGREFRLFSASLEGVTVAPRPALPAVGTRVQAIVNTAGGALQGEYGTVTEWRFEEGRARVAWDRDPTQRPVMYTSYICMPDAPIPLIPPYTRPAGVLARHQGEGEGNGVAIAPMPVPVLVEPVVLFTTYHNVWRDGRVGAGYETYEEAATARGTRGRIDRKEYLSDRSTRFVPSVEN